MLAFALNDGGDGDGVVAQDAGDPRQDAGPVDHHEAEIVFVVQVVQRHHARTRLGAQGVAERRYASAAAAQPVARNVHEVRDHGRRGRHHHRKVGITGE